MKTDLRALEYDFGWELFVDFLRLEDGSYTFSGGAPYQFFILWTKSMDRQSFPRSVLRLFGACLLLGVTGMMLAELHALPFFSCWFEIDRKWMRQVCRAFPACLRAWQRLCERFLSGKCSNHVKAPSSTLASLGQLHLHAGCI